MVALVVILLRATLLIAGHMNNHIKKFSPTLPKADAIAAEALRDDAAFDTEQWQRYIEQEIGFILPNVQCRYANGSSLWFDYHTVVESVAH